MAELHEGETGRDATEILTDDHREFLALVGSIEGEADPRARRELADTLIAEIMRHAVAEEMFVYPAIKEHVPNGAEEVEDDKEEHQEIVLAMKQMEDVEASDPRFMQGVTRLRELLVERGRGAVPQAPRPHSSRGAAGDGHKGGGGEAACANATASERAAFRAVPQDRGAGRWVCGSAARPAGGAPHGVRHPRLQGRFYDSFNTERTLSSRNVYKLNRAAALAEWRALCVA